MSGHFKPFPMNVSARKKRKYFKRIFLQSDCLAGFSVPSYNMLEKFYLCLEGDEPVFI